MPVIQGHGKTTYRDIRMRIDIKELRNEISDLIYHYENKIPFTDNKIETRCYQNFIKNLKQLKGES